MARPTSSNLTAAARRSRASGFTLLELLVAMFMVAALTLSLFQSLRIASRAKSNAEEAIAPSRKAELAMELIRADLDNALPPNPNAASGSTNGQSGLTFTATAGGSGSGSGSGSTPLFLAGNFFGADQADDRGHPGDVVDFSTASDPAPLPNANVNLDAYTRGTNNAANGGGNLAAASGDWTPLAEVKHIELTVTTATDTGDHLLVRRVWTNCLAPQQEDPIEEVVCRGVSAFNVRYYDGTDWYDQWDSTQYDNQLPVALEVTLELDNPRDPNAPFRYVRIIPMTCSNLLNDPNANSGLGGAGGF